MYIFTYEWIYIIHYIIVHIGAGIYIVFIHSWCRELFNIWTKMVQTEGGVIKLNNYAYIDNEWIYIIHYIIVHIGAGIYIVFIHFGAVNYLIFGLK